MAKNKKQQMSDRFLLTLFLTLSGGFQDAYSYMVRDGVFANAQTGNIVLLGTHLISGNLSCAPRYILPILAFAAGIMAAEQTEARFKHAKRIHWRQGILLAEIFILILVGLMPLPLNTPANILVSFACAMQVQSFRKVNGKSYASTMCIGNLRSGTAALSAWLREPSVQILENVLYYFGVILVFAIGAGIGGNLSPLFGIRATWVSPALLTIGVVLMHRRAR